MTTLTRDELVSIARRLLTREYATEEERGRLIAAFERALIHPRASDLIFFPSKEGATAEEIVDEALAYRPIGLI